MPFTGCLQVKTLAQAENGCLKIIQFDRKYVKIVQDSWMPCKVVG